MAYSAVGVNYDVARLSTPGRQYGIAIRIFGIILLKVNIATKRKQLGIRQPQSFLYGRQNITFYTWSICWEGLLKATDTHLGLVISRCGYLEQSHA